MIGRVVLLSMESWGYDNVAVKCVQVNNVGTNVRKPTAEYTSEDYAFVMSTNLESAYHCSQLAHPLLKAADGMASLVFISSVAGVTAIGSGTLYAATKGMSGYPPSYSPEQSIIVRGGSD